MTRAVRVAAPAKLNLVLRVLAREASGWHQIESLFAAVDLADTLTVEVTTQSREVTLEVDGDVGGAAAEDNLVARAVGVFRAASAEALPGLHVRLTKRIPVAAGLGGGSSDAAAVLRALTALFPQAVPERERLGLAAALGSDVPFFLAARPWVWAWGRGGRMLTLEPPPARPVLIAVPQDGVATTGAYAALGEAARLRAAEPWLAEGPELERWETVAGLRENDFESALHPVRPDLARMARAFEETGALLCGMTGSGAAHFGVYATAAELEHAARHLAGVDPGWRVWPSATRTEWPPVEVLG